MKLQVIQQQNKLQRDRFKLQRNEPKLSCGTCKETAIINSQINFLNSFKSMNRLSAMQWVSSPSCAHKLSPAHASSRPQRGEHCRSSPRGAGHAFIFSSWKIRAILRRRPVCWCRAPAHSNRSSGLLQCGRFHPGTRLTWFVSLLFQPIKPACMCRVKRDHWR